MEDPHLQQMQDEMSRFEAEISGPSDGPVPTIRPIIGAATFGAVQQQLERVGIPPPPPPPSLPPGFPGGPSPLMGMPGMPPRMMFPGIPPPPPPPSLLIPSQVQRLRPPGMHDVPFGPPGGMPVVPPLMRPTNLPGPAAMPPPPKPQPVVLTGAPKLYKPKHQDSDKLEKKRKTESKSVPPPSKPEPVVVPAEVVVPATPVVTSDNTHPGKGKKEKKNRKVIRTAGGSTWEDVTLLDWPDDDFRLFCGDLGNDVTDELLIRTFSKYSSFNRAKVVRDKRTNKSKGFGFISFKEPADFIKAMKEMNGRYVGSRPIKLRKSTWQNRALDVVRKKEKEKAALLALLTSGGKKS